MNGDNMNIFVAVLEKKIYFFKKDKNREWEIEYFGGEKYFDFLSMEKVKDFKHEILLKLNKRGFKDFNLYLTYIKEYKNVSKEILNDFYDEDFIAIYSINLEVILKGYFIDENIDNVEFLDEVWFFDEKNDKISIINQESNNKVEFIELLPYFFYKTKISKDNEIEKLIENKKEFKKKNGVLQEYFKIQTEELSKE